MLRETSELIGKRIDATDGHIGSVIDFYFDDAEWAVRYIVVDTGGWLRGRQVLIAPEAVIPGQDVGDALPVDLTRAQIEDSPSILMDQPVSRQQEVAYRQYFGWPPYAAYAPGGMGGPIIPTATMQPMEPIPDAPQGTDAEGDPHLRSVVVVTGNRIEARDGHIGHISDILVDEKTWAVRYLVVDTRDWLPGKHVLIPPQATTGIDWRRAEVHVELDRRQIKAAPAFDSPHQIDEQYEAEVRSYYAAA